MIKSSYKVFIKYLENRDVNLEQIFNNYHTIVSNKGFAWNNIDDSYSYYRMKFESGLYFKVDCKTNNWKITEIKYDKL